MRKVNIQKYLLQAPGIEMTTKVTKNIPPQNTNLHRSVTHLPQRSMRQSTSNNSTQLESCYISLQAVTLHPQQRYLSPANPRFLQTWNLVRQCTGGNIHLLYLSQ